MEWNEESINKMKECGKCGMSYKDIAIIFSLPLAIVRKEFETEQGEIYTYYMQGRLQQELTLRQIIAEAAANGSTPSQNKLFELYKQTDDLHRDLAL